MKGDSFFEVVGIAVLSALAIAVVTPVFTFFLTILYVVLGGIMGWTVEHTFLQEFVIGGIRVLFGFQIQPEQLPAIGAALGFVGSFFKSSLNASHKKD